jgi:2-iminobutanoate/2-iminopropanoate deaminase
LPTPSPWAGRWPGGAASKAESRLASWLWACALGPWQYARVARRCINTPQAPAAVGPYSQAVVDGDRVYSSGQIPIDPATGKLVTGDIAAQTKRVLDNLSAVLTAAGSRLDLVSKSTIFVTDLRDFATINQVYASYFPSEPPARSTVQVAALPLGAAIEIEVVAGLAQPH